MTVRKFIFMMSIGPVQAFIAEARRTADLYAGSAILSAVSAAAARTLTPHTLIFPHPDTINESSEGTPNKLVAILTLPKTENVGQEISTIAQKAQEAALQEWDQLADKAIKHLGVSDTAFNQIWERQKNGLLEFYWVARPIDDGYIAAYEKANEDLDARKRARLFTQAAEAGVKDSLSGERQALHTQKLNAREFWRELRQKDAQLARSVKENELLDTIAAIKRFGVNSANYPSVSSIASADFMHHLTAEDRGALEDTIAAASQKFYPVYPPNKQSGFRYDGDLLYTETYKPNRLKASYGEITSDVEPIVQTLKHLYKKTGSRPSPYYAILVMDGDKMGKHLSFCQSEEEHTDLSATLATFAAGTRKIINDHYGSLVYAGGDDVLAFLPLRTAVDAATAINRSYTKIFANWNQKDSETGKDFPFTMSAGLAIVHHLAPLDWALAEAREAEKAAKNSYGRESIAIRLLKRSGDSRQLGGYWTISMDNSPNPIETVGLVNKLVDYFKTNKLASRLAHDFLAQAQITTVLNDVTPTIKLMVKRHKTDLLSSEDAQNLIDKLATWTQQHNKYSERQGVNKEWLVELGLWLIFTYFLVQGGYDE